MMYNQFSFQNSISMFMKVLTSFHDEAMTILIFIMIYVGWIMLNMMFYKLYSVELQYEGHEIESLWTFMPSLILIMLAMPSLHLLYLIEDNEIEWNTMKVIGHQWYWEYDMYISNTHQNYDSYMTPENELMKGEYRLLEVDNRTVIPWGWSTQIMLTSADVLHAWTVPSLGVKADAVPGRLNKMFLAPNNPGIYYGQCSEICGANHSFMPIVLEVTPWFYTESIYLNN